MSIGSDTSSYNNGGSNGNNRVYDNTYYSRLKFKNNDEQISINYRSGLMQLTIDKVDQSNGFKVDPIISVYLSPNKAQLLANQISDFLAYREGNNIDPFKGFGVNTGMGEKVSFIAFSTDNDKKIYVTIGKFDGNGVITEKHKYEFANHYHYALEWNNIEKNDIVKVFDDLLEIKILQSALYDFTKAIVGASAYGVIDLARYDANKMNKRVDQIFDKLGIERITSHKSYGGSNNYLDNAASFSKSTTLENVDDLLLD